MVSSQYTPIDCSLHDQLLAFATLRQTIEIQFAEGDAIQSIQGRIVDVYTAKTKEEFLKLDNDREIRLDHLKKVGGVEFGEDVCQFVEYKANTK